jgi:hypothetical protein
VMKQFEAVKKTVISATTIDEMMPSAYKARSFKGILEKALEFIDDPPQEVFPGSDGLSETSKLKAVTSFTVGYIEKLLGVVIRMLSNARDFEPATTIALVKIVKELKEECQ